MKQLGWAGVVLMILVVTMGCGGGGASGTFNIVVTISGLSGTGLVLQNNGADNLNVSSNGSLNFSTPLARGSAYEVTVLTQPTGQTCSVANGSGTVGSANVNITITCSNTASLELFAGSITGVGSVDGTGSAASFNEPFGVATDSTGNVYVADSGNNTIRKITPAAVVTTLAGSAGVVGSIDDTGSAASFNQPAGVATDNAGNVYVADTSNNTIRKITPAGVVTTLAGSPGNAPGADGTGSSASFSRPFGLATDNAGNVYVADTIVNTIRKITPDGVVTTLAGFSGEGGSADGTGTSARFTEPFGLATDSRGNVYVADTRNNTIRKITPEGVVTTIVGVAGAAKFIAGPLPGGLMEPRSVAISGTSLYITLQNGVAVVTNLP